MQTQVFLMITPKGVLLPFLFLESLLYEIKKTKNLKHLVVRRAEYVIMDTVIKRRAYDEIISGKKWHRLSGT